MSTIKNLQLVENEQKPFEQAMSQEMDKAIKHLEGELIKVRTGRAHTSMVEDLQVVVYGGQPMALKALAAIAAPDARLITIQPWDESSIGEIERAIKESDLGITPQNDGKVIRLVLPEMSSDRREDLIKILGKKLEEARVAVRNIRKDFNNLIRDAKKDKTISENFFNRLSDVLQKITDKYIKQIDDMGKKKEADITSF